MSENKVEQPSLDEYPLGDSDKIKMLEAETIYRFWNDNETDGRWQAVLLVETQYGKSIRVYRWRWRRGTKWNPDQRKRIPFGDYRWFLEQQLTLNKQRLWDQIKGAVEGFFDKI